MSQPIRVAFVAPSLQLGGAERWMVSLAMNTNPSEIQWVGTALRAPHRVSLSLVGELARCMPVLGITPPGRGQLLPWIQPGTEAAVFAWLADNADCVIAWGPGGSVGPTPPERVIFVAHGARASTCRTALAARPYCDNYVAVSATSRAALPAEIQERTTVIHNGIDEDRCRVTLSRQVVRQQLNLPEKAVLVGHVGRIDPDKSPVALARTVARLPRAYHAVYCGSGRGQQEIQRKVRKMLGGRAHFCGERADVGNVMNALDVVVLASPSEGFGLALVEAWYAGVPTVSTRVGIVAALASEPPVAVTVPVRPHSATLAKAIKRALTAGSKAQLLPRASALARERFTARQMAVNWTSYLQRLLGTAPKPQHCVLA